MCRLLSVVSGNTSDFRFSLREAPRSLSRLSPEHPHGWGVAVHARGRGWEIYKHPSKAGDDERFSEVATSVRGELLVSHIRKRTVGPTGLSNTHPFRRGRWVFAHNGTVKALDYLRQRSSSARLAEIEGDTDSERLFAFVMTILDEVGATEGSEHSPMAKVERALMRALTVAREGRDFGHANFLLSDGRVLFAHRWQRTLYQLHRTRKGGAGARQSAVLFATEPLSAEPWQEVREGTMIAVEATEVPEARLVAC